jgi:hypothetical protein
MVYQNLECGSEVYKSELAQEVLTTMCKRWQQGLISNAEYLHFLNFAANRSFNDPTQYPVFPWVLSDFKSDQLPDEPAAKSVLKSWRDLTKPIGALSADKLDQFKSKYFEIL